jgi:hypothetical protein
MGYLGYKPADKPLTSADITDGIISSADIANGAITSAKLAAGVGGKVLQVVSGTYSTSMTSTSGTYADMNLSVSITPSSSSNKILVHAYCLTAIGGSGGTDAGGGVAILRNSTFITNDSTVYSHYVYDAGATNSEAANIFSACVLDSPATTSAITYKCQFAAFYGGTFYVHRGTPSYIIAMEISA